MGSRKCDLGVGARVKVLRMPAREASRWDCCLGDGPTRDWTPYIGKEAVVVKPFSKGEAYLELVDKTTSSWAFCWPFEYLETIKPVPRYVFTFQNPMELTFDPADSVVMAQKERDISMQQVWDDSIARTLWMLIRSKYMIDDYFRQDILSLANYVCIHRPLTSEAFLKVLRRVDHFEPEPSLPNFCDVALPFVNGEVELTWVVKPMSSKQAVVSGAGQLIPTRILPT